MIRLASCITQCLLRLVALALSEEGSEIRVSSSINSEEGREMRATYQFELYLRNDFYCRRGFIYLSGRCGIRVFSAAADASALAARER